MQKVHGKVQATLTELKNMIGDVLAAVDEHGEVTLTSYNKAKYRIEKIKAAQLEDADETETKVDIKTTNADAASSVESSVLMPPPTTHRNQSADFIELEEVGTDTETVVHPAMLMPAPFAAAPVEQVGETATAAATHALTTEEVAEALHEESMPVIEQETRNEQPADLLSLWANTPEADIWQRANPLELRWAQVARNLI